MSCVDEKCSQALLNLSELSLSRPSLIQGGIFRRGLFSVYPEFLSSPGNTETNRTRNPSRSEHSGVEFLTHSRYLTLCDRPPNAFRGSKPSASVRVRFCLTPCACGLCHFAILSQPGSSGTCVNTLWMLIRLADIGANSTPFLC